MASLIAWLDRFGAAGGEDDLARLRPDQVGNLNAGPLDRVVGRFAIDVAARGIAEVLAQKRRHGLDDGGIERRKAL